MLKGRAQMILAKFNGIPKSELSMIEVAHEILEQRGAVMEFNELLLAVQDYLELSENDLEKKMFVFYTEMNTDGSFIPYGGNNSWGLRSWFPIDSIDEEITAIEEETSSKSKKNKGINVYNTEIDYNNDDAEDQNDYDADETDDLDDEASADEDLTIVSDEELFED